MEFIAQAVHVNRQSVASDIVVFTSPVAETARTETVAPSAATAPAVSKNGSSKTNGDGNGNGSHTVASRLS